MQIAIPSYGRCTTLGAKTLSFLNNMVGVTLSNITIFVANEDEFIDYSRQYPDYHIVIGKLGITAQRNFIMNYYDYNEYVVSLDDDIEDLITLNDNNYYDLFIRGKREMDRTGLTLWGVASTTNTYFYANQKEMSTNLKFCIGQCFGFINKRYHLNETYCKVKQDYLFTLMNYENFGGVVRFNHVGMKSKMFTKGGIGDKKSRWDDNEIAARYIADVYQDLATIVRGGTGYAEIRLRHAHKFETQYD